MTRTMKDSGIEWIGEIPEDWNLMRLQFCLNEIKEKLNNLAISNNNLTSQSNTSSFIESYRMNNRSNRSSINEGRLSTQKRNEKLEEMKNIGERLLSKLEEKDKKLRYLTKQVNNI